MNHANRVDPVRWTARLAAALLVAGCGLFDDSDPPLEGERVRLRDDQAAATRAPVTTAPLPAIDQSANWTHPGGNAAASGGHRAASANLSIAWTADIGTGGASDVALTSQPIIQNGRLYVLDADSEIASFDAQTGTPGWRTDLTPEGEDGDEGFGGGIAADANRIYAATGFGEVLAIDPASGEILWRRAVGAPFRAAPAAARGVVVAVTRDNRAFGFAADTGDIAWRLPGVVADAGILGGSSPAISGELAVIPYLSGEVIGVGLRTGRTLWNAVLTGARRGSASGAISDVTGGPSIVGTVVVAGNRAGRTAGIDGRTGRRGWTRSIGTTGPIWTAPPTLFMVTDTSELVRLDLRSGQTIWSQALPAFEDPEDRDGPIFYSGPLLAGGRVLIGDSLGTLHSFDAQSGAPEATLDLPGAVLLSPIAAGGTVYVLTDRGFLVALR